MLAAVAKAASFDQNGSKAQDFMTLSIFRGGAQELMAENTGRGFLISMLKMIL